MGGFIQPPATGGTVAVPVNRVVVGTGPSVTGFSAFTYNNAAKMITFSDSGTVNLNFTSTNSGFLNGAQMVLGNAIGTAQIVANAAVGSINFQVRGSNGGVNIAQITADYNAGECALTLSGAASQFTIASAVATGASTASFTATNKPGPTNVTTPIEWIRVDRPGVLTRWLPLFAD